MPIPNHFTYNNGHIIPGCIQQGKLAMAVADIDYGGHSTQSTPANKYWYNGHNPQNFILIYSDTYSVGRTNEASAKPVVRKSKSMDFEEVTNTINQLPNRPIKFNDFISAYEWMQSQNLYLMQNINYTSIVTDNMILVFDPCFWGCYPTIGDKIWDFSGSGEYSIIVGATFSTDFGGIIRVTEAEQYIITNNLISKINNTFSIFTWVYVNSPGVIISEQDNTQLNSGLHNALITFSDSDYFTFGLYSTIGMQGFIDETPREIGQWYHVGLTYDGKSNVFKGFVNGELVGSVDNLIKEESETGNRYFLFGAPSDISNGSTQSGNFDFSLCQIHNSVLSSDQILQNYQGIESKYFV